MVGNRSGLTATQIKQAKPQSKEYTLSDGGGLTLRIKPNGTKSWLLRYTKPLTKQRINLSIGQYPDVPLAKAREAAQDARELLANGIDPKTYRDAQAQAKLDKIKHTFEAVTFDWLRKKKADVKLKTYTGIANALINHILPHIGKTPISKINALQVIAVLRPIEARGNIEMVGRICQYLNQIMTYATNHGIIFSNPLSGIKEVFKKKKVTNNPHVKPEELPELMRTIAEADIRKTTKLMIQFQLHTMTRPAETAQAEWQEVDFDAMTWTIPPEKAKTKTPHKIPLTVQTLAILEKMKIVNSLSPFVFASANDANKHANSQTANMALKRMGLQGKQTAHGLRGLARTILSEQGFAYDVSECCLAHKVGSAVSQSYNHSTYFNQRIKIMQWWSAYISECTHTAVSIVGLKTLQGV